MAGPAAVAQGEAAQGLPRNSSIDSAISAMSSQSHPRKTSSDGTGTPDIGNLIKTAGSAEAVIQYLLKEKNSQSQQNSQLWRLVDKQRAMILGLNKDLERALKDKEKYRTKLKEVMATATAPKPAGNTMQARSTRDAPLPRVDVHAPKTQTTFGPDSPVLETNSHKASPSAHGNGTLPDNATCRSCSDASISRQGSAGSCACDAETTGARPRKVRPRGNRPSRRPGTQGSRRRRP